MAFSICATSGAAWFSFLGSCAASCANRFFRHLFVFSMHFSNWPSFPFTAAGWLARLLFYFCSLRGGGVTRAAYPALACKWGTWGKEKSVPTYGKTTPPQKHTLNRITLSSSTNISYYFLVFCGFCCESFVECAWKKGARNIWQTGSSRFVVSESRVQSYDEDLRKRDVDVAICFAPHFCALPCIGPCWSRLGNGGVCRWERKRNYGAGGFGRVRALARWLLLVRVDCVNLLVVRVDSPTHNREFCINGIYALKINSRRFLRVCISEFKRILRTLSKLDGINLAKFGKKSANIWSKLCQILTK